MYNIAPPYKTDLPVPAKYKTKNFIVKNRDVRSQSVPPAERNRMIDKTRAGKKLDKMTELSKIPYDIEKTSIYVQDYNTPGLIQASGGVNDSSGTKNVTATGSYGGKVRLEPIQGLPNRSAQLSAVTDRNNEAGAQQKNDNPESNNFDSSPEGIKRYTRGNWEPRFQVGKRHSSVPSINFKGLKASLYQRDFVDHDLKDTVPIHKPDLWNTFRSNYPMEGKTINKQDYIDWKMPAPERGKDPFRLLTLDIPLNTGTSYRSQFVNWGPNAARLLMPAKPGTVITELPFDDRTVYKGDYNSSKKEMAPSLDRSQLPTAKKESVMVSSIPFLGETCYRSSFQTFKIAASGQAHQKKLVQDAIAPNAAYKDNFTTMKLRDFGDPAGKIYCD